MGNKKAGFKWNSRTVYEGIRGGLFVIKKGAKRYMHPDFTKSFHRRRKRK